jgi:hypothetical protein
MDAKLAELKIDKTLVWHYTSWKGLDGVLSGKLWLSDYSYLNDELEFQYTNGLYRVAVYGDVKAAEAFWPNLKLRDLERFVCVACFSEAADQLSQWRAYGANGLGFAIGFRKAALESLAARYGAQIFQCEYDPELQRRKIEKFAGPVRKAIEGLARMEASPPSESHPTIWRNMGERAIWEAQREGWPVLQLEYGPSFKHPSFFEELEVRLVYRTDSAGPRSAEPLPVKFRQSGTLVVPYVEMPISDELKDLIGAVIVGPSRHRDLNAASASYRIRQAFGTKGDCPIPVVTSDSPYRVS